MLAVTGPYALVIFWGSFAGWLLAETAVFVHGRRIDAPGADRDAGSVWPLLAAAFGAIPLAFLVAGLIPGARVGGWAVFGLGAGVLWTGMGLRLWAVVTLGPFFQPTVTLQRDHRLVTAGPYRRLRHPSYTGGLLILLGMGLCLGDVAAVLVLTVLPLLGYLPRIRVEERALAEGFGAEYVAWAKRTDRLVSGIW